MAFRNYSGYSYQQGDNPDTIEGLTKRVEALEEGGGGGTGTTDYNKLNNIPYINGVQLKGNKTTADLGVSYNDVADKPKINHVELKGDKDSKTDLNISGDGVDDITAQELADMWVAPLP